MGPGSDKKSPSKVLGCCFFTPGLSQHTPNVCGVGNTCCEIPPRDIVCSGEMWANTVSRQQ